MNQFHYETSHINSNGRTVPAYLRVYDGRDRQVTLAVCTDPVTAGRIVDALNTPKPEQPKEGEEDADEQTEHATIHNALKFMFPR